MSRPIPEGVKRCTEHGPGFHPYCPACAMDAGKFPAPSGSEVARVNYPEIPDSSEDPRDGAIRALVQKWREEASERGNLHKGVIQCADELEAALGKETE